MYFVQLCVCFGRADSFCFRFLTYQSTEKDSQHLAGTLLFSSQLGWIILPCQSVHSIFSYLTSHFLSWVQQNLKRHSFYTWFVLSVSHQCNVSSEEIRGDKIKLFTCVRFFICTVYMCVYEQRKVKRSGPLSKMSDFKQN